MSIQWITEDIEAATGLLSAIGEALCDPAETTQISSEGRFVRALGKTLGGVRDLLRDGENLKWEHDLDEHARNLKSRIEEFWALIGKVNTTIPEAPEYQSLVARLDKSDLAGYVKSLQDNSSRSQLVLDMFINLHTLSSLLEQSRTMTRTVEQLKTETKEVCHILPTIAASINGLNDARSFRLRGLKGVQQYAECLVRGDLDDMKSSLLELQEVQIPLSQESRAQWQEDLAVTIEELCGCCQTHLDVLLGRGNETDAEILEKQKSSWQRTLNSLVEIVDGELAGGLTIACALESHEQPTREATKPVSRNSPLELCADDFSRHVVMANERGQKVTTIQTRLYMPPPRGGEPNNRAKEIGSRDSSDKENGYIKSSQHRGQNSEWQSPPFSKPALASKNSLGRRGAVTPATKFQQRMLQRQNKYTLNQEIPTQNPRELSSKSMLGPDQYSFALERWVNHSDHLEMLLNTGKQNLQKDMEILIAVPEDHSSVVGRFPKILMKTMADWDNDYNLTSNMMSSVAKLQIAA